MKRLSNVRHAVGNCTVPKSRWSAWWHHFVRWPRYFEQEWLRR